ncbi:hypothetical protein [Nocardioides acrostichi]|uniref:EF-hand domain-containing protein n=1 Tax=Nocardioides acrostichi TaxID=2784339 RepID=A0A930Y947_9ACTN|nr:hypothetical protein [Nocardioides acrostichi]MBF4163792.1 hypothetical protein [Nocardioides acrostichi]
MRKLAGLLLASVTSVVIVVTSVAYAAPTSSPTPAMHFADGNIPSECIVDRDPINPDNHCYHMKVGLNGLDTPKVDVDVLIPVSPDAERDMRIASQSVQMWDDGLHYLAKQEGLTWLNDGFEMDVRTHQVVVDSDGALQEPLDLVDPEIVVIVSNPAGGIGIGIDPAYFAGELGLLDGGDVPCAEIENPMSMSTWQGMKGFDQHGGEPGGVYVQDCGGVGGNVCFAVNGAIDPVPGATDFFPLFDLVSHEFGHCLTLGHVGDGADGPWGPTPTNDIMAYSTDPPLVNKCVSSLDLEGFALRMSRYLDVDGNGKVDQHDLLVPNDVEGDASNSFQVQHPADHTYASSTGDARDCPQPDLSATPLAEGDFMPKPEATTKPQLKIKGASRRGGVLRITGVARHRPLGKQPTATKAVRKDASGDSYSPITDLQGLDVQVSRGAIDATLKVGRLWPVTVGTSLVAYSLNIDGRRLDSFIPTGSTDGEVVVMDNGTGYYLPAGTATWDFDTDTVRFHVRRDYLADQQITAPYNVYGVTGYHARSNDWIANDDLVPDARNLDLAGPRMTRETRDAPRATKVTTATEQLGTGTFTSSDSTLGVGLVSAVDGRDYVPVPVRKQSSVLVTLTWTGEASMDLTVGGGSGQEVIETDDPNTIQVLVPWARRDLVATVDPQEIYGTASYTLTARTTTLVADRDGDGVYDVADACPTRRGPASAAGCGDRDHDTYLDTADRCPRVAGDDGFGCPRRDGERVVALVDGKRVAARPVVTSRGSYRVTLAERVRGRVDRVTLVWYDGAKVLARATRRLH